MALNSVLVLHRLLCMARKHSCADKNLKAVGEKQANTGVEIGQKKGKQVTAGCMETVLSDPRLLCARRLEFFRRSLNRSIV